MEVKGQCRREEYTITHCLIDKENPSIEDNALFICVMIGRFL